MASIQNRNGHYLITICNGYDVNGKKIRHVRTFTPNPLRTKKQQERDLQQFVREFEEEIESGVSQDGRKITFKAFSERWLAEYAVNLQPGTIAKYTQELESKIYPAIGHRAIRAEAGRIEFLLRQPGQGRRQAGRQARRLLRRKHRQDPERRLRHPAHRGAAGSD